MTHMTPISMVSSVLYNLAHARARGVGSPQTVEQCYLPYRVLRDPEDDGHGIGRGGVGGGHGRGPET